MGFRKLYRPANGHGVERMKRLASSVCAAGVLLLMGAGQAAGSITLGQLATAPNGCLANTDWVEPAVSSGVVPYVVPSGYGTITSWSTQAFGSSGAALTLRIFRPTSTALTFAAVAHDGPHTLNSPGLNTFPVNVAVQPGDLIGLHAGAGAPTCVAVAGSDPAYFHIGDLQDGQQGGPFSLLNNRRLNVKAEVAPTVTGQRAAALKRCKKRAHKKHWSHKRLKKCKKKAQLLAI
jgi:hypothetical protein